MQGDTHRPETSRLLLCRLLQCQEHKEQSWAWGGLQRRGEPPTARSPSKAPCGEQATGKACSHRAWRGAKAAPRDTASSSGAAPASLHRKDVPFSSSRSWRSSGASPPPQLSPGTSPRSPCSQECRGPGPAHTVCCGSGHCKQGREGRLRPRAELFLAPRECLESSPRSITAMPTVHSGAAAEVFPGTDSQSLMPSKADAGDSQSSCPEAPYCSPPQGSQKTACHSPEDLGPQAVRWRSSTEVLLQPGPCVKELVCQEQATASPKQLCPPTHPVDNSSHTSPF